MMTTMTHATCGKKLKLSILFGHDGIIFESTKCHKCGIRIPGKSIKDKGVRETFKIVCSDS